MNCGDCGKKISRQAKFCAACGKPIEAAPPEDRAGAAAQIPGRRKRTWVIGASLAMIVVIVICGALYYLRLVRAAADEKNLAQAVELAKGPGADKALELLLPLAKRGVARAQYNLGALYQSGSGVEKSSAQAADWFRKAAVQGYAAAQFALGYDYDNGEGVAKDPVEAAVWYRKAAHAGDKNAQYNLGRKLVRAEGVARDYPQAAVWFRKAAEQGDADAQDMLALMLYQGQGVTKDVDQAATWWQKAAAQGKAEATAALAEMQSMAASGSLAGVTDAATLACDGLYSGNLMTSVRVRATVEFKTSSGGEWDFSLKGERVDGAHTLTDESVYSREMDFSDGERMVVLDKTSPAVWDVVNVHINKDGTHQFWTHLQLDRAAGRLAFVSRYGDENSSNPSADSIYSGYCHAQTADEMHVVAREAAATALRDNPRLAIAMNMPFAQGQVCNSLRTQLIRFAQVTAARDQDWEAYLDRVTSVAAQSGCLAQ